MERFQAVRALSRAIAAPLVGRRRDASSRCPTPRRPNGISPIAAGSSKPSSFAIMSPTIATTTKAGPICSTPIMKARAIASPAPAAACSAGPRWHEVLAYRTHVDDALLNARCATCRHRRSALVELGLHHEQQHQELMLMDMLAAFAENPLLPALWNGAAAAPPLALAPDSAAGSKAAGGWPRSAHRRATASPSTAKGPRHPVLIHPHELADRPVTNAEWLRFIDDGGYRRPSCGCRTAGPGCRRTDRSAALLAAQDGRERLEPLRPRRLQPAQPRRAGLPYQLLRSRRFRPLGRRATADRGGMGSRRGRHRSRRRQSSSTRAGPVRPRPAPPTASGPAPDVRRSSGNGR